jgi:hypothetical protein
MSNILWLGLALVGLMLVVYLVVKLTRRGETAALSDLSATAPPVPRYGDEIRPGGDRLPLDHLAPAPDPAPAPAPFPAPSPPSAPLRPAPDYGVEPPSPRLPPSPRPVRPPVPAEPPDARPLRAPGSMRPPRSSPSQPGPGPRSGPAGPTTPGGLPAPARRPPASRPPAPTGPPSSAAAEPLVRARVGKRDDTWRPTPREASPADQDDAADRFGSSRAVPKYVPGIDELRPPVPGPGDGADHGGRPPAARAPAGAPAEGARPPAPERARPAKSASVIDFTGSRRGPAPGGPGRPVKGRPLTPPSPGRRAGGHPIAPPAGAAGPAGGPPTEPGTPTPAAADAAVTPPAPEPEAGQARVVAPEVVAPEVVAPEVVAPEVVEPEVVAPEVVVAGAAETDAPAFEAVSDPVDAEVEPDAEVDGDDVVIDLRDGAPEPAGPAPEGVADDVVIDLRDGVAAPEPAADDVVIDLRDEAPAPPRVEFEPEDDQVDQILHALVRRARERRVAIADVAVELVEQAELEDRDIDDVLADLVENTPGDGEELVLYNRSVPSRPGRLVDLDSLGVEEKKRIIVRVLCLLVALQEESNAETAAARSAAEGEPPTGTDTDAGVEGGTVTEAAGGSEAQGADPAAGAPAPAGTAGDGWAPTESAWPVPLDDPEGGTGGDDDLPDRRLLRGWHT